MANPQQPELRRSGRNEALSPDAVRARVEATRPVEPDAHGPGPVPEENRATGQPGHDQDKPDLDAFAEKLGIVADEDSGADEQLGPDDVVGPSGDLGPGEDVEPGERPAAGPVHLVVDREPRIGPARRAAGLYTRVVLTPWVVVGRIAERTQELILVRIENRRE